MVHKTQLEHMTLVEHNLLKEHKLVEHMRLVVRQLVIEHIRLIVRRLVVEHIGLIVGLLVVGQLVFQLDSIQLFLNICQQEHILNLNIKLGTSHFIICDLWDVFSLVLNCLVFSYISLSRHLDPLSNFFILNV